MNNSSRLTAVFATLSLLLLAVSFTANKAFASDRTIPIPENVYIQSKDGSATPTQSPDLQVGYVKPYCPPKGAWDTTQRICPASFRSRTFLHLPPIETLTSGITESDISRVVLHLYQFDMRSWVSYPIQLYSPTSDWDQTTVTWNSQPQLGSLVKQVNILPSIGWVDLDVTTWFRDVIQGTQPNHGFVLKAYNEVVTATYFYSSRCLNSQVVPPCTYDKIPYMTIEYNDNATPSAPTLNDPLDETLTNEPDLTFSWNESSDPDGDEIVYFLELSDTSTFDRSTRFGPFLSGNTYTTVHLNDGTYFWRVAVSDNRGSSSGMEYSVIRSLTIDTIAPAPPVMASIPEYTIGTVQTIQWETGTTDSSVPPKYNAEVSTTSDFSTILRNSGWISETSTTFGQLSDNTLYYYRVFEQDEAGNISTSSNIVSSLQDSSLNISMVSTLPEAIDILPLECATNTSVAVTATVSGGINPSWTVKLSDATEVLRWSAEGSGSEITTGIPVNQSVFSSAGIYHIIIVTNDISGNRATSGPLSLAISSIQDTCADDSDTGTPTNPPDNGSGDNDSADDDEQEPGTTNPGDSDDNTGELPSRYRRPHDQTPSTSSSTSCFVTVNVTTGTYQTTSCNPLKPVIKSITNKGLDTNGTNWLDIQEIVRTSFIVHLNYVRCKPKTVTDPRTWTTCVIQKVYATTKNATARAVPSFTVSNGGSLTINQYKSGEHSTLNVTAHAPTNLEGLTISSRVQYLAQLHTVGMLITLNPLSEYSAAKTVPKAPVSESTPFAFGFVFENPVGVTQWHGYTAFQSPHTGIDFGVTEKYVIAPEDGTIDLLGWDSYYGACLSGGNFIKIRYKNGMYTMFFHLKNLLQPDGQPWNVNDTVVKGQRVALSGNTGAWNCQPLGYHLHYEIRTTKDQSSHVNPVIYTPIDWNTIPTLNWQTYPQRLSGDNPHPSF